MRPQSNLLLAAAMALLTAGCAPDKPEVINRVSAGGDQQVAYVVDDESFTVEDVNDRLQSLPEWARARFGTVDRKKGFLATLAQFELMVDEAERLGYDEHPETLDRYEEAFVDGWIDAQIEADPPADSEVRAHFEDQIDRFRRGEARTTYIILTTSEQRAKTLRQRIMGAPVDERTEAFRTVATDFSLDRPSGQAGGLVGAITDSGTQIKAGEPEFFRPPDDWTGEFLEVPWELEARTVSRPMERDGRWLLVYWDELVPAEEVEFDEIADRVREDLVAERREALVAEFRE